jgi:RNA recognition motif-containing protein
MQDNRLYVGNLNYAVADEELQKLFEEFGEVKEVRIIKNKGFGFVEMVEPDDAEKAKESLNGTDFMGRSLRIDKARPPKSNPPRREFKRY